MLTVLYWVLVEVLPLGVRADDHAHRAVSIDVVGAVLSVVLDDEDRRLGPGFAVTYVLDDPAQRQVVAGHASLRRERAGAGTRGVVLPQTHHHEARQGPVLLKVLELLDERFGIVGVAAVAAGFSGDSIVGAHVPDQTRNGAFDPERAVGLANPASVLAVTAVR